MFTPDSHALMVPFDGRCRLADYATLPDADTLASRDWEKRLDKQRRELGRWQHKLFADQRFAMLVIFQALDAAGKDSTIRHVFTGVNPTGVRVVSFKRPSATEIAHDFLWRTTAQLPERGYIGVFNRSYYEEVIAVRVHPELLAAQRLAATATPDFWQERYRSIVEHEAHLARSGTVILKFWLNVSKEEQHRHSQVLAQRFQGRAATALARTHRAAQQTLEIRPQRHRGTRPLARLHPSVRGLSVRDLTTVGPVVRNPRGRQRLYAMYCRRNN